MRDNGDTYIYHIQLSGITNNSLSSCVGGNICQVKVNGDYNRVVGSSSTAKYYIKGTVPPRPAPPRPWIAPAFKPPRLSPVPQERPWR